MSDHQKHLLSQIELGDELAHDVRIRLLWDLLDLLPENASIEPRTNGSRLSVRYVMVTDEGEAALSNPGNDSGVAELMWEVLAGRELNVEDPPRVHDVVDEIHPDLDELTVRALSGEVGSVGELVDELVRFAGPEAASRAGVQVAFGFKADEIPEAVAAPPEAIVAEAPAGDDDPALAAVAAVEANRLKASVRPLPDEVLETGWGTLPPPSAPPPESSDVAARGRFASWGEDPLDDIDLAGIEKLDSSPPGSQPSLVRDRSSPPPEPGPDSISPEEGPTVTDITPLPPPKIRVQTPSDLPPGNVALDPTLVVLLSVESSDALALALALEGFDLNAQVTDMYDWSPSQQETCPCCVVTDAREVSVAEVVGRIRRSPLRSTPIVALAPFEQATEAFHAGADVCINLPSDPTEWAAQIQAVARMRTRLARTKQSKAISGDLAQTSLGTVLMILELERRTGIFKVTRAGRRAAVEIVGGLAIGGTIDGATTDPGQAMRRIMEWKGGRFSFQETQQKQVANARTTLGQVLIETARQIDEDAHNESG